MTRLRPSGYAGQGRKWRWRVSALNVTPAWGEVAVATTFACENGDEITHTRKFNNHPAIGHPRPFGRFERGDYERVGVAFVDRMHAIMAAGAWIEA